jgi:hypothetical protein
MHIRQPVCHTAILQSASQPLTAANRMRIVLGTQHNQCDDHHWHAATAIARQKKPARLRTPDRLPAELADAARGQCVHALPQRNPSNVAAVRPLPQTSAATRFRGLDRLPRSHADILRKCTPRAMGRPQHSVARVAFATLANRARRASPRHISRPIDLHEISSRSNARLMHRLQRTAAQDFSADRARRSACAGEPDGVRSAVLAAQAGGGLRRSA